MAENCLITNDVENIFICVSLVKCLFQPLFFTCLFTVLLSTKNSLHILNAKLSCNMCFINIFSQSLVFLFIAVTVSFEESNFKNQSEINFVLIFVDVR